MNNMYILIVWRRSINSGDHSSRVWEALNQAQASTEIKEEMLVLSNSTEEVGEWVRETGKATNPNGLYCGVHSSDQAKHDHCDVGKLLLPCVSTRFVMQHCWVHIAQRYTNSTIISNQDDIFWNKPYHAKLPTKATNLSKSAAPTQLIPVQVITMANLKIFLYHLTRVSAFPLRVKSPFSKIRTAGNSCKGTESNIASE